MTTITVKNIPPEIYEKLKQAAAANYRSINSEIIACIERVVVSRPLDPDALLVNARRLRGLTAAHPVTDSELTLTKRAGRP
jgi:plasmid stability protein